MVATAWFHSRTVAWQVLQPFWIRLSLSTAARKRSKLATVTCEGAVPSAEHQRMNRDSPARRNRSGSSPSRAAQAGVSGCSRRPGMMLVPVSTSARKRRLRLLAQRRGLTLAAAGSALRSSRLSRARSAGSSCGVSPSTRHTVRIAEIMAPAWRGSVAMAGSRSITAARVGAAGSRNGLRPGRGGGMVMDTDGLQLTGDDLSSNG
jgi:hypothetical protein